MPTVPNEIATWLVCFGCLLWISNSMVKLVRGFQSPRPQPPNETLAASNDELSRRLAALEHDGKMRTAGVYRKMDEVEIRMRLDIKDMDKKFDAKIEDLPERILNMLRNIKDIGHRP